MCYLFSHLNLQQLFVDMEPQSLSCEATLAKTLEVLEKTEKENTSLKMTIQGLEAQLQQKNKELSRLKRDMDEVSVYVCVCVCVCV